MSVECVRDVLICSSKASSRYGVHVEPGNIEDLEGFQKVPNGRTIFKKDCTVGMLMDLLE